MTSSSPQTENLSSATLKGITIYPNPIVQFATVSFSTDKATAVKISVTDMTGKLLKTITNQNFSEGNHEVKFNRESLPAGIFFLQLKTNDGVVMKKIMVQ